MDRVTLIVVPEASEPVRRLRVPRALVRFGPAGLAALGIAFAALAADWVRLRLEAAELVGLRAQVLGDEAALAGLAVQVRSLEARLGRVAEFERKVRIAADLPEAAPVPAAGRVDASALPEPPPGGLGGESEGASAPAVSAPPAQAPGVATGSAGSAPPPAGAAPPAPGAAPAAGRASPAPALGLRRAIFERVRARVEALLAGAARLDRSLESLAVDLGRRRERLAATPAIAPVAGWITSGFGWRRSPFTGRRQHHRGLDIAAAHGTPFVATAAGRVAFAGVRGALGRTVVVEHGHGFETTYGHASALHVRSGERVERGQRLGVVGSSGRSTGPHVHYAVVLGGRPVDPADYLLD